MSSNRKWGDITIANNHRLGTKAGYSLLELLASVAISGIVLAAITTTFMGQSRSYDAQEQVNEMQQNVRAAMDLISREVRLAGYLMPNTAVAIPYSASQLEVRADLDGDGNTSGGDVNERIIYSYDAVKRQILRNPGGFGGGNEVLAENIGGFDSSGNPVSGFTFAYLNGVGFPTTNPADIRQIQITITGRTAGIDPNYPANGGYRTYTLTSLITPRNLAL